VVAATGAHSDATRLTPGYLTLTSSGLSLPTFNGYLRHALAGVFFTHP
jgi:hypothetical protein